jgi:hypothetical protein
MDRTARYPYHLAKRVAARLRAEGRECPSETVLTRLLETLYFTSLKTDEGRPLLCTVNYADPQALDGEPHAPGKASNGNGLDQPGPPDPMSAGTSADCWNYVPFDRPLPLDVRTLAKLAKAADPAYSSLAVYADRGHKLSIWGMVDQELEYGNFLALDAAATAPQRPGLFQATITGVGNVSVYVNYSLVASLEQNTLVEEYHDVLWAGPVHQILHAHFQSFLQAEAAAAGLDTVCEEYRSLESGLLVRWLNALCRVLMNIQHYRHGGGLLIVPDDLHDGLSIKYRVNYRRLPQALLGITRHELHRSRLTSEIRARCLDPARDSVRCDQVFELRNARRKFDEFKSAVLGCGHFIASLSCVDGFVLLDPHLAVRGFGVEARPGHQLSDVYVAGDCDAHPKLLRRAELSQFGTRHRAMMRYCYEHEGALGFVISQDGDIRAMTRIGKRLVLWENIDVELAFRSENGGLLAPLPSVAQPSASAA